MANQGRREFLNQRLETAKQNLASVETRISEIEHQLNSLEKVESFRFGKDEDYSIGDTFTFSRNSNYRPFNWTPMAAIKIKQDTWRTTSYFNDTKEVSFNKLVKTFFSTSSNIKLILEDGRVINYG